LITITVGHADQGFRLVDLGSANGTFIIDPQSAKVIKVPVAPLRLGEHS
jgi:hypothetical protein